MSLMQFVDALLETGEVTVSTGWPVEPGDGFAAKVEEMDRIQRLQLALPAPALSLPVAAWAARILYRACQLFISRDLGEAAVKEGLSSPCPLPRSPSTDYSADLFLQFLPDLIVQAERTAAGDPLVEQLRRLAREWPLSSAGTAGLEALDLESFRSSPALMRLYVDRIIERCDKTRLGTAAVDETVKEALGAFPELAPRLALQLGLKGESP